MKMVSIYYTLEEETNYSGHSYMASAMPKMVSI